MPKHKPIRFQEAGWSDGAKELVNNFMKNHPVASSVVKAVLATAVIGGVLTTAAVAPGVLGAVGRQIARKKKEKRERYNQLWARFHDLRKRNAFEFVGENAKGELVYKFTERGREVARKFVLEALEISSPRKWDGKWRIVIFDIPERLKKQRRLFQTELKVLGFYPLQKSVFVHPFPCEQEIAFLKDFLQIKPHVELLISNEMPSGRVLYNFRELIKKRI